MYYNSFDMHFMSGTGNSFRAAKWMVEIAEEQGITSKLYQMFKGNCNTSDPGEDPKDQLMGMVFPTHGLTAPWLVIKYALRLPGGRGKHAFVIATRAGTRIASISLPGLEGTAGYIIALILFLKGYLVRGVMGLDMPSNWTALHWGMSSENSRFIIERAKAKADNFIRNVLEGKTIFKGLLPFLIGVLLSPVSAAYLAIGRFFLSKLFFTSPGCTGCGLCAGSCPAKAIKMVGRKRSRPYWTFACESCMRCMGYCPNKAVEASHPLAIVYYLIYTVPVYEYVRRQLSYFITIDYYGVLFSTVLNYFYLMISFYLVYLIFFWFGKIPFMNNLCTHMTLTHFWRRYHEPDTSVTDIMPGNTNSTEHELKGKDLPSRLSEHC